MILRRAGISAWLTNSEGNPLEEYQVQETTNGAIQCWVASVEDTNFKIQWEVIGDLHPGLDLCAFPSLDGVKFTGGVLYQKSIAKGEVGQLYEESTGVSTARLYEFGKRELTDKETGIQLDDSMAKRLNTIRIDFAWGRGGDSKFKTHFEEYEDMGPIHEMTVKKGHTGAVKLGKTISIDRATRCNFYPNKTIKQARFIFCYAPEDWLRARGIIADAPEPDPQSAHSSQKRARSTTPEVIDVDQLDTDDDEIQFIPATFGSNKRQRTMTQERAVRFKVEDA